jgi:hypothetical protein
LKASTLDITITSDIKQEVTLVLPPGMVAEKLTVNGAVQTLVSQGTRKQGCKLLLMKGKPVAIEAKFHPDGK